MRIFIAGPYGDHNPKDVIAQNVARADAAARLLMSQGHEVCCVHKMSWGWEDDPRITRDQCIKLDNGLLEHWAEAIYRIPGESPGADAEIALAESLGLRIFEEGV
jgi:hypothetical protein